MILSLSGLWSEHRNAAWDVAVHQHDGLAPIQRRRNTRDHRVSQRTSLVRNDLLTLTSSSSSTSSTTFDFLSHLQPAAWNARIQLDSCWLQGDASCGNDYNARQASECDWRPASSASGRALDLFLWQCAPLPWGSLWANGRGEREVTQNWFGWLHAFVLHQGPLARSLPRLHSQANSRPSWTCAFLFFNRKFRRKS